MSLNACGPDTYEHFCKFSVNQLVEELKNAIPDVYALFMNLGDVNRNVQDDGTTSLNEVKVVSALCTLLNARTNGLQLLLSMMLIVGKEVNSTIIVTLILCIGVKIIFLLQALSVLNHAGVCMSYYSTWEYLRSLTKQARYNDAVVIGYGFIL